MIPNTALRVVHSNDLGKSADFGISLGDSAHLMTILRDTLYSDKVLAVLREYSSNAWDAHKMVKKGDVPIKITLPTLESPTLSIRDYGPGLSQDEVFNVYTQYGASTKRNSDEMVGTLGIGSKAGFAYSDSFSITSFNGGMKRNYVAVLDPSNKGKITLLHEEPTKETGILIQIAIRAPDINEFTAKAQSLFRFFNPQPVINTVLTPLPKASKHGLKNGFIFEDPENKKWTAVMGCIPYQVDLTQLAGFNSGEGLASFFPNLAGVLYFGIGELNISASRESLKYTDPTKALLISRFNELVEEYVRHFLVELDNKDMTDWQRRFSARRLVKLKVKLTGREWLVEDTIDVEGRVPEGLKLCRWSTEESVRNITVDPSSKLVIRDNRRTLKLYNLSGRDYLVYADQKMSTAEVDAAVAKMCADFRITGITTSRLSELPIDQTVKAKHAAILNHRKRVFTYKHNVAYPQKRSDRWQAENHTPSADDVFVLINFFEVLSPAAEFYSSIVTDARLAKEFKRILPPIYAYKSTDAKPMDQTKIEGTHYETWRKLFIKSLMTPRTFRAMEMWAWNRTFHGVMLSNSRIEIAVTELTKALGKQHPLTEYFRLVTMGVKWAKTHKSRFSSNGMLDTLITEAVDTKVWVPGQGVREAELLAKYPLILHTESSLAEFAKADNVKYWTDYVRGMDLLNASAQTGVP